MRIVFHVGMGKTGTTSLQATLARNEDRLLKAGIAYPRVDSTSHQLLSAIAVPYNRRPRGFRSLSAEDWKAAAQRMEAALACAAAKRPRVLVLSTEYAFNFSCAGHDRIRDMLLAFSQNVSVHVWLRHPIPYFVSYSNQRAKPIGDPLRDRRLPNPETFSPGLRKRVSRLRRTWGSESVALHYYDRAVMAGGDAISDFIEKAVPEASAVDLHRLNKNAEPAPPIDPSIEAVLRQSCADDLAFLVEEGFASVLWEGPGDQSAGF